MLTVGGEDPVGGLHRRDSADLGGLLSQGRGPQRQLALTLQAGGLSVQTAFPTHVPIEVPQGGVVERLQISAVDLVIAQRAVFGQQLYDFFHVLSLSRVQCPRL